MEFGEDEDEQHESAMFEQRSMSQYSDQIQDFEQYNCCFGFIKYG
jgi:hypothetical protein